MNKKRILLLGGSYFQIPSILYAKKAGYYVITCDFSPENPGHKFADEYHNVSTTDMEKVLALATKLKIDGIVAYASDPAAPTAAFISDKLNLPGNPYNSVHLLTEKDLYRTFLETHDFNVPSSKGYTQLSLAISEFDQFKPPVMIKPVDSSGSKGVRRIHKKEELEEAFNYALKFSQAKRVIIEEFLDKNGPQIHGDLFVLDSKIQFSYLGDHHYNVEVNPFVPYSTTLPSIHSDLILKNIEREVQRLIGLLNIKQGAFNIEARVSTAGEIYLMEIGARNGGNFVPQLEQYASGFNMTEATVEVAMGNDKFNTDFDKKGYFAYYVIHSKTDGILQDIKLSEEVTKNIIEKHIFKNTGDAVNSFHGSNASIGLLLLEFTSRDEMLNIIEGREQFIRVEVI